MIAFTAVAAFGMGPWQGDMNAVIANCSEYTYLTKHKRVDGTMYSCTSLGVKLEEDLELRLQAGFWNSATLTVHLLYSRIPALACFILCICGFQL